MSSLLCLYLVSILYLSLANPFARLWSHSIRQSLYEQEVEDVNSLHRIGNHLARRLIVMPLTDIFKANSVDPMYGKVHYGDKCSLPSSIGKIIFDQRYEVPWLFEIKPVKRKSKLAPSVAISNGSPGEDDEIAKPYYRRGKIDSSYISPLDFRAPENYIFLPKWLMNDLNLQPYDAVDVSFVRIRLADLVVLQPLSLSWDALIEEIGDPKSLLEHEVNKYSSLTAGSTIYIEMKGKEYALYVKETRAEGGVAVKAVRIQDSDVRADIDRTVLDQLIDRQEDQKKKVQ
ncbi:hypothetical protein EON65_05955 [archaeon]|nr:MAG: hypothetical protein EON65_05955 [archaeon]